MAALRLGLWAGKWILGFCDADDQHDFVMRPDDVAVHALGVWVDGPAAVIVLLDGLLAVIVSFAIDDLVVRRTTLANVNQCQEMRMERWVEDRRDLPVPVP